MAEACSTAIGSRSSLLSVGASSGLGRMHMEAGLFVRGLLDSMT